MALLKTRLNSAGLSSRARFGKRAAVSDISAGLRQTGADGPWRDGRSILYGHRL
jgi:hypothetical protein